MAHFYSWLTFVVSTLVIGTIASEFIRGGRVLQSKLQTNIFGAMYHLTRRNMRRYGGYVVHFGVVLVVIGVAGQAFNLEKEQEMGLGDKLQVGHYSWLARNTRRTITRITNPEPALLDVYKDGKVSEAALILETRIFKASRQPNHIVANYSTLRENLYVIYEGNNPDTGHPIIKAFVNPLVAWVWIGVVVIIFGTGLALVPNAQQLRSTVPGGSSCSIP